MPSGQPVVTNRRTFSTSSDSTGSSLNRAPRTASGVWECGDEGASLLKEGCHRVFREANATLDSYGSIFEAPLDLDRILKAPGSKFDTIPVPTGVVDVDLELVGALGPSLPSSKMEEENEKNVLRHEALSWIPLDLLEMVQSSGAYPDCKTFVDMPTRPGIDTSEASREVKRALPGGSKAVRLVLERYFEAAGSDVIVPQKVSSCPRPPACIPENVHCKLWAQDLASRWPSLLRTCKSTKGSASSLLPFPHPMVIPSGRFREAYYWDSYWCALALEDCGMHAESAVALQNLLWAIRTYGLVPNGARSYYLGRSQPPLLASCLNRLAHAQEDDTLDLLLEEYRYATAEPRTIRVMLENCQEAILHRYWSDTDTPRPESYREDVNLARGLKEEEKRRLWRDLSSACASGWDFSARWMEKEFALSSTRTTRIIPVDLNAFLLQMELAIASIARDRGKSGVANTFHEYAETRRAAIENVLWSAPDQRWRDMAMSLEDFSTSLTGASIPKSHLKPVQGIYASDFIPLWCDAEATKQQAVEAVSSLEKSGLIMPGGLVASDQKSGQQWDFPNVWPPLVHMLVEGVAKHVDTDNPKSLDREIASNFLCNVWEGWKASGNMYEKYDGCTGVGASGGGGEYEVQIGFGWTNAVVLLLLKAGYGDKIGCKKDLECIHSA